MLTSLRPWLSRAIRTLKRPANDDRAPLRSFRPRIEGLEERTLLASSLLLSGFPSLTTAGAAGNLTVAAEQPDGSIDTAYTGTIVFSTTDAQADLPASYTFTADDQGVHTFSATLKTAGTQSLTATDTVTNSI